MNYIKTNHKLARQRGATLIELSVVIAVILLLVGVLFVGVSAWKDNANRAACLVNLSSLQKAVRGYQNSHADDPSVTTYSMADLTGAGYFAAPGPKCPSVGDYSVSGDGTFPPSGTPAFVCANATTKGHTPGSTANW